MRKTDYSSENSSTVTLKYDEDAITQLIGRITDDVFYCSLFLSKYPVLFNRAHFTELNELINKEEPHRKTELMRMLFFCTDEFTLRDENGRCSLFDPEVPPQFRLDKEKYYEFKIIGNKRIEIKEKN